LTTQQICDRIYLESKQLLKNATPDECANPSLFVGEWSNLFYLFYYEQIFLDENEWEASDYLEKLYENLDTSSHNYTYCNGLSGPYWLLNHLNKNNFIETDDIFTDFIGSAITVNNHLIASHNFDFLHGSAGTCNFLLEFSENNLVKEHLSGFVNALFSFSILTEKGRSIPMFLDINDPATTQKTDAFSLAHGTCALQIILMKIHERGIEKELCKQLIYETIAFMLDHELVSLQGTLHGLFPSHVKPNNLLKYSSRVSWCYGDMNIATMLWQCGNYFNEQQWISKSLEILHHNAKRDSFEASGVVDACLCHGAAGNAAMFRRFWFDTNEKSFLTCSDSWYKLSLNTIKFSENPFEKGIKTYRGDNEGWQYSSDILNGSSGIGLSLLSSLSTSPLAWDQSLLLS